MTNEVVTVYHVKTKLGAYVGFVSRQISQDAILAHVDRIAKVGAAVKKDPRARIEYETFKDRKLAVDQYDAYWDAGHQLNGKNTRQHLEVGTHKNGVVSATEPVTFTKDVEHTLFGVALLGKTIVTSVGKFRVRLEQVTEE